jgi:hypothetical protein
MARYFGWDEKVPEANKGGSGGGGNGIDYLKLEIGKRYRVRLVAKPFGYFQHWEPIICRSPEMDESGVTLDPLMLQGLQPKPRFAIWVFDRNDGNKLKIMDFAPTMLEQFKIFKDNFQDDPGGSKGPDFIIEGKCPGGDKRKTKWTCSYLERSPFTEEEVALIKTKDAKGLNLQERLADARKPHTPDQIREMLEKKKGAGAPPAQAAAASNATPKAASSEEVLF